jgi:cytochrome c peroxidase
MADGSQYTLQMQAKAVITNPDEMGGNEKELVEKVLSCKDYKKVFSELIKQTPQETKITKEHVVSAITYYYSKFSQHASPFDLAMNNQIELNESVQTGFNIFMSKAQCATCHFAPHFNGVKPPYVGSEFEVLGVPSDTSYSSLSKDKGRYNINPAEETLHAFRTGTLRNIAQTKPYMHNGIFNTLEQVVSFYNNGGGLGHGLNVPNQTLSGDSLHLSMEEQVQLIKFMEALTEDIPKETPPNQLPVSSNAMYKNRLVGGIY